MADRWLRTMAYYAGLYKNDVVGHKSYETYYNLGNRPNKYVSKVYIPTIELITIAQAL